MSAGGFANRKTTNPISLGATIAIHVVVVGVLLLSKTEYFPKIPTILEMTDINLADSYPPPPPPDVPDKPVQKSVLQPPKPIVANQDNSAGFEVITPTATDNPPINNSTYEEVKPVFQPAPVLVDAAVDPRYAADFQPPYPPAKLRLSENGRVVVRVQVGTDGRVKAIELVSASDTAFFEATKRHALRRWRFTPATRDGVAVDSWRTMTLRFEMTN